MKQNRSRSGYILPVTLLVLSCTLLWGSTLLLTLSDQYAASTDYVCREQSRLLARSGWNLALQQLDSSGTLDAVSLKKTCGCADVTITQKEDNLIAIQSKAEAQGYPSVAEGVVRLLAIPWIETSGWCLTDSLQSLQEAAVFCTAEPQIFLSGVLEQPAAVSSINNGPITVLIQEPVVCRELYINGDLQVEETGSLEAEAVYASGQIYGAERISSDRVFQQYTSGIDYRVMLVSRVM